MNIFPLVAVGVSTLNSSNDLLDVRYHLILNEDQELLNTLNIDNCLLYTSPSPRD